MILLHIIARTESDARASSTGRKRGGFSAPHEDSHGRPPAGIRKTLNWAYNIFLDPRRDSEVL